jgi:hypothetical protein
LTWELAFGAQVQITWLVPGRLRVAIWILEYDDDAIIDANDEATFCVAARLPLVLELVTVALRTAGTDHVRPLTFNFTGEHHRPAIMHSNSGG